MSHEHRRFSEELDDLKQRLQAMGGLAEERLRAAMRALVDRDHDALADIIAGDSRIDDLQIDIDDRYIAEDVIFIVEARDIRHRSAGSLAPHDHTSVTGPALERRKHFGMPPV